MIVDLVRHIVYVAAGFMVILLCVMVVIGVMAFTNWAAMHQVLATAIFSAFGALLASYFIGRHLLKDEYE